MRSGGAQAPMFCLHPTGGHVNEYASLQKLISDRPVYTIASCARLDASLEHPTLVAMANAYATSIERERPGPCRLFGWSMGGLIAHAVGCELERRGVYVELVGMVDPPAPPWDVAGADEGRSMAVQMAIQILHPSPPAPRVVRREMASFDDRLADDPAALLAWCEERQLLSSKDVSVAALGATVGLYARHRTLVREHTPARCTAPITLWRPDPRYRRVHYDWSQHTSSRVDERVIMGAAHYTLMRSPYVEAVVAGLCDGP